MAGSGSADNEPGQIAEAVLSEIDQLRAQVATITAERDQAQAATAKMAARCERLLACVEHYASTITWNEDDPYIYLLPGNGWDFAREALAGGENETR